jgi:hypothetical protein
LQRCPASSEKDAKEKDRDDCAVGEVVIRGCGCGKCGKQDIGDKAATETAYKHFAAAEAVQEGSAVDGSKHREYGVDSVNKKLLVRVGYTCVLNLFVALIICTKSKFI